MRYLNRRVLGWSVFALLLVGMAWALDAWLPPEPRWTVGGDCNDALFSPDGERVLTVSHDRGGHGSCGPIRIRDVASGRTILEFAADLDYLVTQRMSPDFRQWVGIGRRAGDPRPLLVSADLVTGQQRYTQLTIPGKYTQAFGWPIPDAAPAGLILTMTSADHRRRIGGFTFDTAHFIDIPTGECLTSLPACSGFASQFTPDGQSFVHEIEPLNGARRFGVWDLRARRSGPPIDVGNSATQVYLGPDSRTLYVFSTNAPDRYHVTLWDLPTAAPRAAFAHGIPQRLALAKDGRRFALVAFARERGRGGNVDDVVASVCDVRGGHKLVDVPVGAAADAHFSNDGRLLFIVDQHAGQTRFRMFDVDERRARWEAAWPGIARWTDTPYVEFAGADGKRLLVTNPRTADIEVFDARSGASQWQLQARLPAGWENTAGPPALRGPYIYHGLHLMPDKRIMLLPKSTIRRWLESWLPLRDRSADVLEMAQVVDMASGHERLRITLAMGSLSWLSADGASLLVREEIDGQPEVRCYDVPPARPWQLILGIPLAVGAALLVGRVGWRRIRRAGALAEGGSAS